ncbi:XRE family transcriptional regulator [Burkholderia gladioli]|uniref:XRE family transcriptional regulator n=1 Tax=Burkholderia gladioli TaxID=28095 RepID=UPI00164179E8|nr:XRE family transcriptional regulator [Burkholderia gladioli]
MNTLETSPTPIPAAMADQSLFSKTALPVPKAGTARKERRQKREPLAPSLTESNRRRVVGAALDRFVRDPLKPAEMENLRYNLIRARVMSGLTEVEAAQAMGYANSTQLCLIEKGQRPIKETFRFLLDASRAYSVSIDFLLGLSTHTEPDGKIAHQYAVARHMADVLGAVGSKLAETMHEYMEHSYPTVSDFRKTIEAAEGVESALTTLREKHGFDDMPGGSKLHRAVELLLAAVAPLRPRLEKAQRIDGYMADMERGFIPDVRFAARDARIAEPSQHELPIAD